MPSQTRLLQADACGVIAASVVVVLLALTPTATARVTTLTINNTQPAFVVSGVPTNFGNL